MYDSNDFYFVAKDILSRTSSDEFTDILNITIKKDKPIEYEKIVKNRKNKPQQIIDLLNCYDSLTLNQEKFIERLEAARPEAIKNIAKEIKEQIGINSFLPSTDLPSREVDPLDTDSYRKYSVGEPTQPETRELQPEEFDKIRQEIDVAIITATDPEASWVLNYFEPYPGKDSLLVFFPSHVSSYVYTIGKFGRYKTVHVQCRIGTLRALLATLEIRDLWLPRVVFMVGVAFGIEYGKQKYGDVLIADEITAYEMQWIGEDKGKEKKERIEFFGQHNPSTKRLVNTILHIANIAKDWGTHLRPDGQPCKAIPGKILAGDKLIDNSAFKQKLLETHSNDAVGGEMEGAGVSAAALERGTPWILAKAICDWADGSRTHDHQALAAKSAASLIHCVLSKETVLQGLDKPKSLDELFKEWSNKKLDGTQTTENL